jgi:hypothetical protein
LLDSVKNILLLYNNPKLLITERCKISGSEVKALVSAHPHCSSCGEGY